MSSLLLRNDLKIQELILFGNNPVQRSDKIHKPRHALNKFLISFQEHVTEDDILTELYLNKAMLGNIPQL